jgi:hypothetical protein
MDAVMSPAQRAALRGTRTRARSSLEEKKSDDDDEIE